MYSLSSLFFFFSSRRRHTRLQGDWSSDVCSSDLVYDRLERGYARLIGVLVRHSGLSVVAALILIGIGGYGLSRVPTGFIPIEDQGYLLAAVQLPDGAALDRTQS